MKRLRFSEEQITGFLKNNQAGFGAKERCRWHGSTKRHSTCESRSIAGSKRLT